MHSEGNDHGAPESPSLVARGVGLEIVIEDWPMAEPIRLSGHTLCAAQVVVVTLRWQGHVGRGEACGLFYQGDTPLRLQAQIEAVRLPIESGLTRARLRELMPPGGARNAVDCALWELEARCSGKAVWEMAGLAAPKHLLTTITISAGSPERMTLAATQRYPLARALKLKLLGDGQDAERVRAVRIGRPDVWLGVDGNQGFDEAALRALLPTLEAERVALIEQPLPVGHDAKLAAIKTSIPFAADESAQSLVDLPAIAECFDVVNIKLDKCGGLTEALLMVDLARRLNLKTMVGCMGGTSLAMAPALLVGQRCDIVDLDGPLLLVADRTPGLAYEHGMVKAAAGTWGSQPA